MFFLRLSLICPSFLLLVAAFFAWIFAVVTVGSCRLVEINGNAVGLGLFKRSFNGSRCRSYENILDGAHWVARFFGVVGCLAVSLACLGLVVVVCFGNTTRWPRVVQQKHRLWWLTRRLWEVALVCTLLVFVFFLSDWRFVFCRLATASCRNGGATVGTVLNIFLLLFIIVLVEGVVVMDGTSETSGGKVEPVTEEVMEEAHNVPKEDLIEESKEEVKEKVEDDTETPTITEIMETDGDDLEKPKEEAKVYELKSLGPKSNSKYTSSSRKPQRTVEHAPTAEIEC